MDNMLTVSHPTPVRNARQILAEVTKTMNAITEAKFNIAKKEVNIRKLKNQIAIEKLDAFDKELKEIEIAELESQIKQTINYVSGAIRKMTNYANQYNSILKKLGKEVLTEEDFENEEVEYHIKKAFEQALCAARSHGGFIDEGNQIYLTQIGINGTVAQKMMSGYLVKEARMIEDVAKGVVGARLPNHEDQLKFLDEMYQTFKECSNQYSEKKGMSTRTEEALFGGVKE